jgi:hypothetical protein
MLFTNLKDGLQVQVFIPTLQRFYKMDVTAQVQGGFSICNYDTGKINLIQGHEFLRSVYNQEDVDNFFYMTDEPIGPEATKLAEQHYEKNGLSWIF